MTRKYYRNHITIGIIGEMKEIIIIAFIHQWINLLLILLIILIIHGKEMVWNLEIIEILP